MRPNGGWSSSGTQNMQSSMGQYSTQAGDPAQPVQHSVMTANSLGFFFRTVSMPADLGSNLSSSGTMPTALASGMAEIITQPLASGTWHLAIRIEPGQDDLVSLPLPSTSFPKWNWLNAKR